MSRIKQVNKSDNSESQETHVCPWLFYLGLFKAEDRATTTSAMSKPSGFWLYPQIGIQRQQHVSKGWKVLRNLEMWVLLQLCWAVIPDNFLARFTLRKPHTRDTASWVQTQQLNHSIKPVSVFRFFLTFMLLCFCFLTTEQDKTQCHRYRFKNWVEGIPFGEQTVPLLPSKEALTWFKEQKALGCLQGCYCSQMMTSARNQCQQAVPWTACTNTPQQP